MGTTIDWDKIGMVDDLYADAIRKLSGMQSVMLGFAMSDAFAEAVGQRIRAEHPNWADHEVRREFFRRMYPDMPWPEALDRPPYRDQPFDLGRTIPGMTSPR